MKESFNKFPNFPNFQNPICFTFSPWPTSRPSPAPSGRPGRGAGRRRQSLGRRGLAAGAEEGLGLQMDRNLDDLDGIRWLIGWSQKWLIGWCLRANGWLVWWMVSWLMLVDVDVNHIICQVTIWNSGKIRQWLCYWIRKMNENDD